MTTYDRIPRSRQESIARALERAGVDSRRITVDRPEYGLVLAKYRYHLLALRYEDGPTPAYGVRRRYSAASTTAGTAFPPLYFECLVDLIDHATNVLPH